MDNFITEIFSRIATSLFAPRPHISHQNGALVIQSGWRTSMLTLGTRHRKVTIDVNRNLLRIRDRRFWFLINVQIINFSQIHEIIYSYCDLFGNGWVSHDSQDLYNVGLWLKDQREVSLFKFYGQGVFVNNSLLPAGENHYPCRGESLNTQWTQNHLR
jgi:hypothetical protein